MKEYATFVYGRWAGYLPMEKIEAFKKQFHRYALDTDYDTEHLIYAYYDYTDVEDRVYHFDILPKTEEEFKRISSLPDYFIYALHKGETAQVV